jgi:hypothetical protein
LKRVLGFIIGMLIVLSWLINTFQSCTADYDSGDATPIETEDYEEYDSLSPLHHHKRSWLDYYNSEYYTVKYAVSGAWEDEAFQDRDAFTVEYWQTDDDFWQQVYYELYNKNKSRLTFIQDSLSVIRDSLQLDHDAFARVVVSFVQDIPYNYILPDSCAGHDDHPCLGNVKYGILSPVEFLNSLQGDCDTRTVLLFTLLRNFGYEPVIINSNEYLHSMLALDIPTSGEYLEYKGKHYAFWETTNVGWLPGMLPPDMSNTSYWNVILDL